MAFLLPQKGGRKVEDKISPPPLKSPLYKGNPSDLVEVEVKYNFSLAQCGQAPLRPK
jgi:hypothetical protein